MRLLMSISHVLKKQMQRRRRRRRGYTEKRFSVRFKETGKCVIISQGAK